MKRTQKEEDRGGAGAGSEEKLRARHFNIVQLNLWARWRAPTCEKRLSDNQQITESTGESDFVSRRIMHE